MNSLPLPRHFPRWLLGIAALGAVIIAVSHAADPPPASAPAMPAHTNRLAKEKSPYLLQHAHNPVDWYPWGEEAFAKAKKENKPIFLSIGYSTCHWCHVMERESFENPEIAKLINDTFVPIKIDREERPDIDRVYMTFVQATTGSGGWPMTILLTPDLQPFFGGTYFPPETRGGMTGMKTLIPRVAELWRDDRERIVKSAGKLTEMLQEIGKGSTTQPTTGPAEAPVSQQLLSAGLNILQTRFDKAHGGFGDAPKFPEPPTLQFLVHAAHTLPDNAERAAARQMLLATLDGMAAGGIHDQIGGGFHRYSTDERWFLPHFEKMLYDQAQLAMVYADAFRMTGDARYAAVTRDILDYVNAYLSGPAGQFYCAEDADSARESGKNAEKIEGAFYVWSAEEIRRIVGEPASAMVLSAFGVDAKGNVARDPRREFVSLNVLSMPEPLAVLAKQFNQTPEQAQSTLEQARKKLFAERAKRPRPHLDDKALTAWNGLMISGFARAGTALNQDAYVKRAADAARFIESHLYEAKTHTLKRRYRDESAEIEGFLEDYAYFIQGLVDLYEASLDFHWLQLALDLQAKQNELFWDADKGGYFNSAAGDTRLLVRMKDETDGAEPCGNSVAAMNLLRLSQMTDDAAMKERALKTIAAFSTRLRGTPQALPYMLTAVDFAAGKPRQIVIAGDPASPQTRALLAEVHKHYLPNRIILSADGGPSQALLETRLPFVKGMKPINGKSAAYVCQNYACQQPTTDPAELAAQLAK